MMDFALMHPWITLVIVLLVLIVVEEIQANFFTWLFHRGGK